MLATFSRTIDVKTTSSTVRSDELLVRLATSDATISTLLSFVGTWYEANISHKRQFCLILDSKFQTFFFKQLPNNCKIGRAPKGHYIELLLLSLIEKLCIHTFDSFFNAVILANDGFSRNWQLGLTVTFWISAGAAVRV